VSPMSAYAIMPAVEAPAEKVVDSMMALSRSAIPTIYMHRPGVQAPYGPDTRSLPCSCKTLGELIETARLKVTADLYLWVPPGVKVLKDGLESFVEAFEKSPDSGLLVSNYKSGDRDVRIFPMRDDLTEREDFGAVWGFSAKALEEIGGANPDLRYTTFYDLRLRLMEVGGLLHIPKFTHIVESAEEGDSKAASLYFPGKGAFGGFSYLFMDKEEERETEEVFEACLKRRHAFLELPENTVTPVQQQPGSPLASVIIPVHNRARFLPLAIDSVLRGDFQDFEILVVDNASNDESLEVAMEYAAKNSRIRVLENDVNLISKALNMGVAEARGRYIAQLDSDDEYTGNTLADMVAHLESHPKCGLAISYYVLMDEEGITLEDFGIIKHLEYNLNNILRVDGAGAVRVWHKSVIQEFGGFNEPDFPNYGEDYDLVLKVSEKYQVDRVHSVCYRYRRHPGNTDALRRPEDKIRAKTFARLRAVERRRTLNEKRG